MIKTIFRIFNLFNLVYPRKFSDIFTISKGYNRFRWSKLPLAEVPHQIGHFKEYYEKKTFPKFSDADLPRGVREEANSDFPTYIFNF